MATLAAMFLSLILVLVTITIHYEALRKISDVIPQLSVPARARILVVIVGVFIAHLLEVSLYAIVYALMQNHFGLGAIAGASDGNVLDYFYFSITSYTTLRVGDVYPTGPLRIVSSMESLNGFVLIGWSASFTYLAMERFWEGQRRASRQ